MNQGLTRCLRALTAYGFLRVLSQILLVET